MDVIESELEGFTPRAQWTRRGFVMTSLATGFALSVQPVSAETIHTDTSGLEAGEVKVPVADGSIPAYRAMPNKGGPFPTVLVVQEVFGVHEHIKEISDIKELVAKIVSKVPDAQVMSDLDASVAYAKSTGKADAAKLAVTGFCWGGRITWLYAAHSPDLKAAVAWYGSDRPVTDLQPKNPVDIAADLKAPMLALYGGADPSNKPETIDKRQAACTAAGKTCDKIVYPDAPHGFNADYRPSYRADAAKDGWAKMLAWFKKYGVG
jgi:carboxymethylenebutenolidase